MENTLIMMKLEYQYEKAGSTTAKDQGDGIVVDKHIYFQLKILKIQVRQSLHCK